MITFCIDVLALWGLSPRKKRLIWMFKKSPSSPNTRILTTIFPEPPVACLWPLHKPGALKACSPFSTELTYSAPIGPFPLVVENKIIFSTDQWKCWGFWAFIWLLDSPLLVQQTKYKHCQSNDLTWDVVFCVFILSFPVHLWILF